MMYILFSSSYDLEQFVSTELTCQDFSSLDCPDDCIKACTEEKILCYFEHVRIPELEPFVVIKWGEHKATYNRSLSIVSCHAYTGLGFYDLSEDFISRFKYAIEHHEDNLREFVRDITRRYNIEFLALSCECLELDPDIVIYEPGKLLVDYPVVVIYFRELTFDKVTYLMSYSKLIARLLTIVARKSKDVIKCLARGLLLQRDIVPSLLERERAKAIYEYIKRELAGNQEKDVLLWLY